MRNASHLPLKHLVLAPYYIRGRGVSSVMPAPAYAGTGSGWHPEMAFYKQLDSGSVIPDLIWDRNDAVVKSPTFTICETSL